MLNIVSKYAIPTILLTILVFGFFTKTPVYDSFIAGVKEGMETVLNIIPPILAILTAVGMLRQSGAFDVITYVFKPLANIAGIPQEVVPLMLLRPVSGGGSLGMLADILSSYGADSFTGRLASTVMGATETTFYTIAVYFSATRVKNIRYCMSAALISDFAGMCVAVIVCKMMF